MKNVAEVRKTRSTKGRRPFPRGLKPENGIPRSSVPSVELIWVGMMVVIITVVAMIDVYWSIRTQDILHQTEKNPVGRLLIECDNGSIALFMTMKMLGTMLVILAIPALYYFRRRWGIFCSTAVGVFQLLLLAYFETGHLISSGV